MGVEVQLQNTAELRNLLQSAAKGPDVSQVRRLLATVHGPKVFQVGRNFIPDRLAAERARFSKQLGTADTGGVEAAGEHSTVDQACQGGGLLLASPPPREKSPELKARLATLQKRLESQQYAAMVKDITRKERDIAARAESSLVTYKDQLGYGVHILVLMGSLYAAGHWLGRSISESPVHHVMCGLVGLVLALLVEAVLYIIRTGYTPGPSVQAAHAQMHRQALQQQQDKKVQ